MVLVVAAAFTLLTPGAALPCSLSSLPPQLDALDKGNGIPLVKSTDLIVRVTAAGYAVDAPSSNRDSRIRFRVEAVLRGTYEGEDIILPGQLVERPNWRRDAPYTRGGGGGSCFWDQYQTGGQFLLFLKHSGCQFSSGTHAYLPYAVEWLPLGPVNEQIRGTNDPWVVWVEEQVKAAKEDAEREAAKLATAPASPAKAPFCFVLNYGENADKPNRLDTIKDTFQKDLISSGTAATTLKLSAAELGELQKKLEQIDFWNKAKFPDVFSVPDPTCRREPVSTIRLTVIQGVDYRELTWKEDTCPILTYAPASELLEWIATVRGMVEAKPEYLKLPIAGAYQ
jgi:hypothetical protein